MRYMHQCPHDYKVGDEYDTGFGRKMRITGFGVVFKKFIPDEDTSAWGLQPGRDYRIDMQYIYGEQITQTQETGGTR